MLAKNIAKSVSHLWSENDSTDDVLSLGFTFPYLAYLQAKYASIMPIMPSKQGAMAWPSVDNNLVVLSNEWELPCGKHSVNRILLAHLLEHSRHLSQALNECWNVLVPGGRMIIIVPNRRSLWAQSSASPLGWGQPFSARQLRKNVEKAGFTVLNTETTHFSLPLDYRLLHKIAPAFELLGKMFFPMFGGVLVMEVEKQIYASINEADTHSIEKVLIENSRSVVSSKNNAKNI